MFPLPELPVNTVNPTPYTQYIETEPGTHETPILTYVTHGNRSFSRIFHSKQEGKYYESTVRNCQKKKFEVFCIYNGQRKAGSCMNSYWMKPKNLDHIIRVQSKDGKRSRFKKCHKVKRKTYLTSWGHETQEYISFIENGLLYQKLSMVYKHVVDRLLFCV